MSDKATTDSTVYTETTAHGKPCTSEGYMNVELAAKFADVKLEELEKQARAKFGPLFARLELLSNASNAALQFLDQPAKDQLQLMAIAHQLSAIVEITGVELESEWPLYQVWLTKRAGLTVKGIQDYAEYFVSRADAAEGEEVAE